jgi:hypothetical protein
MRRTINVILIVIVALAAIVGITWVVQGNEFFLYRYFAPKMEQVRRQTFEQTKSYRQGMTQELENMRFEYEKAAPEQKAALASIILHRAADVDEAMMNTDLIEFIHKLRRERNQ